LSVNDQYEKHHVMIPLLINQSDISRDLSLQLSKCVANSELVIIGLTGIRAGVCQLMIEKGWGLSGNNIEGLGFVK
jgi:hypothetical protein